MSRLTLSAALSQLGDATVDGYAVFPRGADTTQKTALINEVLERFINMMPSWKGIDGTASFAVYNNQVTLPRELQTIKRAGYVGDQGQFQVPIRNQWFQFHTNGPGIWNPNNPRLTMLSFDDLGDGYCTFREASSPFKLSVDTDVSEIGSITFYGYDTNGVPVYTGSTQGLQLSLTNGSTTTQVFQALGKVVKPVTNGRVLLYSVDAATAVRSLIAIYEPGETVPSYRRYQVTGAINEQRTFKALCKRAFVKVVSDNDTIVPDNLSAIKMGLMWLSCESKQDVEQANYFEKKCISYLNSQLEEDQGDVGFTAMIQNRCFAGSGIRNMI